MKEINRRGTMKDNKNREWLVWNGKLKWSRLEQYYKRNKLTKSYVLFIKSEFQLFLYHIDVILYYSLIFSPFEQPPLKLRLPSIFHQKPTNHTFQKGRRNFIILITQIKSATNPNKIKLTQILFSTHHNSSKEQIYTPPTHCKGHHLHQQYAYLSEINHSPIRRQEQLHIRICRWII